jgi:hypothetical protein
VKDPFLEQKTGEHGFMGGIIAHSVTGIEHGMRNSLDLFVHESNSDVLKTHTGKEPFLGPVHHGCDDTGIAILEKRDRRVVSIFGLVSNIKTQFRIPKLGHLGLNTWFWPRFLENASAPERWKRFSAHRNCSCEQTSPCYSASHAQSP